MAINNASAVKIYNTMSSLVSFANKNIFIYLSKNGLAYYNACVVVVILEVAGLAPGIKRLKQILFLNNSKFFALKYCRPLKKAPPGTVYAWLKKHIYLSDKSFFVCLLFNLTEQSLSLFISNKPSGRQCCLTYIVARTQF
jgi:hypothetical protein